MDELNDRARTILRAVVLEFIETGQPVGSRTLADKHCHDISPATIRNVLAELEEAGYLYQPHTSAGRVPTDRGFRLFVDGLMPMSVLSRQEEAEIHSLDDLPPGADLFRETGRVLSELAGMASVILASRGDSRVLSQLNFIRANDGGALLAVLMFRDGAIETRFVPCEAVPSERDIQRMHGLLQEALPGQSLRGIRDLFASRLIDERREIDELSRRTFELALTAMDATPEEPIVVIQGQDRLIEQPDFGDVDRLRELVRAFDEKNQLISLLDLTIDARTVQVLVGHEAGNLAGGALSFVVAPFTEGGNPVGMVGVVGPTRMNYPKLIPLVSATARAVSDAHDRGTRGPRRLVGRHRRIVRERS